VSTGEAMIIIHELARYVPSTLSVRSCAYDGVLRGAQRDLFDVPRQLIGVAALRIRAGRQLWLSRGALPARLVEVKRDLPSMSNN
jgi:hypothetical protein